MHSVKKCLWLAAISVGQLVAALEVNWDSQGRLNFLKFGNSVLTPADSIKQAASTMVWDMLQEYKGNKSIPGAPPGLLPDPPYAWWLGGVGGRSISRLDS